MRVDEGLGLVTYTAHFPRAAPTRACPTWAISASRPARRRCSTRVAGELGWPAVRPPRCSPTAGVLPRHFRYTLYLSGARPGRTALEEFLLTTRAGHCEYFATATALLLREAGVPARYAVGYAVHEWSRVEGRWIVRARDAHAWALAWVDGAWVEVDTTPLGVDRRRDRRRLVVAVGERPVGVGRISRSRAGAGASGRTG